MYAFLMDERNLRSYGCPVCCKGRIWIWLLQKMGVHSSHWHLGNVHSSLSVSGFDQKLCTAYEKIFPNEGFIKTSKLLWKALTNWNFLMKIFHQKIPELALFFFLARFGSSPQLLENTFFLCRINKHKFFQLIKTEQY